MRACARVALASIAVSASFSLSGCAAIEELKETFLRWIESEKLSSVLAKYATYYNEVRTHVSLGKDAPCRRPVERFGDIVAYPVLGGLHHRYARI